MEVIEEIEDAGPRITGIEVGNLSRGGHTYQRIRAEGHARVHNGDVVVHSGGSYTYYEQGAGPEPVAAEVVRRLVDEGTIVQLVRAIQQEQAKQGGHEHISHELGPSKGQSRRPQRKHIQQSWKWSITLQPWLVSKLWRVSVSRSQAGWTANLRTANVVPKMSPIFNLANYGDISGIQRLIESGQASLFDVNEDGYNIIENASFGSSVPTIALIRFYLDYTRTDPSELISSLSTCDRSDADLYVTLIEHYGADFSELLEPGDAPSWWSNMRNIDCIRLVQKSLPVAYGGLSPEQRLSKALSILKPSLSMFLTAAGYEADPGGLANVTAPDGRTALHFVADNFDHSESDLDEYLAFVRALHDSGADLNPLDKYGTPLMQLIRCRWRNIEGVGPWLDLLHSAGVDLMSYGRKELDVWSARRDLRIPSYNDLNVFEIVGFTYDSSPGKWELIYSYFVDLPIFRLPQPPGTWIDGCAERYRISTIWWSPDESEATEGVWVFDQYKRIRSGHRTMPNEKLWSHPKPPKQYNGPYDDTTPIALMLMRPRTQRSLKKRGQSQPPMDRLAKHEQMAKKSPSEDHTEGFHVCNVKVPARLHYRRYGLTEARYCLRGHYDDDTNFWSNIKLRLEKFAYQKDYWTYLQGDYRFCGESVGCIAWPPNAWPPWFDEYVAGRRALHRAGKRAGHSGAWSSRVPLGRKSHYSSLLVSLQRDMFDMLI